MASSSCRSNSSNSRHAVEDSKNKSVASQSPTHKCEGIRRIVLKRGSRPYAPQFSPASGGEGIAYAWAHTPLSATLLRWRIWSVRFCQNYYVTNDE